MAKNPLLIVILAIAVFGGYYSVIIWMCAFLLLLLVYKLSSAESKLRTLRNSQETLNDDQSSFIALLVSCKQVEFYLVKALWILIAVIPISIPVLSVIFASDSSVAVSLLFLVILIRVYSIRTVKEAVQSKLCSMVAEYSVGRGQVKKDVHIQEEPNNSTFTKISELLDDTTEPEKNSLTESKESVSSYIMVQELQLEAVKGLLYMKRFNDTFWTPLFCCTQDMQIICFTKREMNTKSVAVIELSEFEYAQEISVEDIIRQDIVSDPGIHDEFLSNGGFFLLEAKEDQDSNMYFKSSDIPANTWTRALNKQIYNNEEIDCKIVSKPIPKPAENCEGVNEAIVFVQEPSVTKVHLVSLDVSAKQLKEFCIKFGWLYKKGIKYGAEKRASKKRFFVLHQGRKVLYYFLKENSNRAKGYINLAEGCTLELGKKTASFVISDNEQHRDFVIKAENEKDAAAWINIIASIKE